MANDGECRFIMTSRVYQHERSAPKNASTPRATYEMPFAKCSRTAPLSHQGHGMADPVGQRVSSGRLVVCIERTVGDDSQPYHEAFSQPTLLEYLLQICRDHAPCLLVS